jgi:hypothetical protein
MPMECRCYPKKWLLGGCHCTFGVNDYRQNPLRPGASTIHRQVLGTRFGTLLKTYTPPDFASSPRRCGRFFPIFFLCSTSTYIELFPVKKSALPRVLGGREHRESNLWSTSCACLIGRECRPARDKFNLIAIGSGARARSPTPVGAVVSRACSSSTFVFLLP